MFCKACNTQKASSEFYVSDRTHCKACVRARVRRHRRLNDSVREYDRKRGNRQEGAKPWRRKNPAKYKAQNVLNNALRDGKIKREPCYFCGAKVVHGHHQDYSRPLDVTWLCPRCHHRLHALEKAA